MDTPQITAPPRAPSPVPGDATPSSGVIHINFRHAAGFTVIGNHLTQHRGLSLAAIGLAAHIQSLPAGARIGIKQLAERFPESETRIAAALRELEAHGYLHRSRVRLADGRIVTRTVSYNQPGAVTHPVAAPRPRTAPSKPTPQSAPPPRATTPEPRPGPAPAPPPALTPQPAPVLVPAPTARTTPPPPLPRPQELTPELQRAATAPLADLRRHAPQLVLCENDIHALAPGIAAWLERDTHPDTIRHTLTTDLPVPLKHPAKLLRHRITTLLPPPLPGAQDVTARARPGAIVIPLQNCDRCDRAFRSRHPGHCRDCRTDLHTAA
ncbi:helix-turn-helix domain-containing protein [Streptomyces sp. NBC_01591]|uniref:helix-turn-helix domain-containing protein n=1 Tax=Streptomyces sp. NBC_01591 TaxID=2975888 RepID=UPI002DD7A55E|nr:helix-turn-helix domain-containing protein [Streptomyces sp. NBC_01591]WSD68838.1 helix-turn-helix domain-containing protein [Streptomyces sp. NBC_01591]